MSSFSNNSKHTVFCFFKRLDNETSLECSVCMMPITGKHTCGYTITLTATKGNVPESATLENVTFDKNIAEQIFDHICTRHIPPTKLSDTVKQFITL